jgi:hypothetical protein
MSKKTSSKSRKCGKMNNDEKLNIFYKFFFIGSLAGLVLMLIFYFLERVEFIEPIIVLGILGFSLGENIIVLLIFVMLGFTLLFWLLWYESKSKVDKGGNKYERLIANHYVLNKGEYFIRALASGGKRGKFTIELFNRRRNCRKK